MEIDGLESKTQHTQSQKERIAPTHRNPEKKSQETEGTINWIIRTTEGHTYQVQLPAKPTTEDVREALRRVGAGEFASQVHSIGLREKNLLRQLRNMWNEAGARLTLVKESLKNAISEEMPTPLDTSPYEGDEPTVPWIITAQDGQRYRVQLPKKPTHEDMRGALGRTGLLGPTETMTMREAPKLDQLRDVWQKAGARLAPVKTAISQVITPPRPPQNTTQ